LTSKSTNRSLVARSHAAGGRRSEVAPSGRVPARPPALRRTSSFDTNAAGSPVAHVRPAVDRMPGCSELARPCPYYLCAAAIGLSLRPNQMARSTATPASSAQTPVPGQCLNPQQASFRSMCPVGANPLELPAFRRHRPKREQRLTNGHNASGSLDKLGVTGSSPVPPTQTLAERQHPLPRSLTKTTSQVFVK